MNWMIEKSVISIFLTYYKGRNTMELRIAAFNLENLDDGPNVEPPLADRIVIMRPQLFLFPNPVCFLFINSCLCLELHNIQFGLFV